MGPRLVPATIVSAIIALTVAAVAVALAPERPRLWSAAVGLVVLGGITPLIYAVNIRIVPVFSRRSWPSLRTLRACVALGVGGAWAVFLGRALPSDVIQGLGSAAALLGGLLFVFSVVSLFRSPASQQPGPPLPFPEQAEVDRAGTRFMRLASIYLLFGLGVGVALALWTPARGRWDLVWAHSLLVGWFLSMASGVCYHVLSRWTGEPWRRPRLILAHLRLVELGLPVMVLALALDLRWVFFVAGPLQTAALLLFLWNIVPLARRLPGVSRLGFLSAAAFLGLGVLLGASMAVDPVHHATLRFTHAQINLFGWTGLLISGAGYYLFPRFAGQPLRWPRLAKAQIVAQSFGVVLSATAWWVFISVDPAARVLVTSGSLLAAASLGTFALIVAATFRRSGHVSAPATLRPRSGPAMR